MMRPAGLHLACPLEPLASSLKPLKNTDTPASWSWFCRCGLSPGLRVSGRSAGDAGAQPSFTGWGWGFFQFVESLQESKWHPHLQSLELLHRKLSPVTSTSSWWLLISGPSCPTSWGLRSLHPDNLKETADRVHSTHCAWGGLCLWTLRFQLSGKPHQYSIGFPVVTRRDVGLSHS